MEKEEGKREVPKRPDWDSYFLQLAFVAAQKSPCLHHHVGAVFVIDNRQIATGYNGTVSGETNCCDLGYCNKERVASEKGEKAVSGKGKDDCKAIHGEENAILQGSIIGNSLKGATAYVTHQPCYDCSARMAQIGIGEVKYCFPYRDTRGIEFLRKRGINVVQLEKPSLEITVLE